MPEHDDNPQSSDEQPHDFPDLARYLGADFDPENVGKLPDAECDYCGRQAATGEHGCCRWCREYLNGVAVAAAVGR